MDLLSGSFGVGRISYDRGTLEIHPTGFLSKGESISIGDVVDLQQVGGDASKKIRETAALGGMGLAVGSLLGPVGALAGLAAGAMAGGKKNHVTFVCRLRDGRNFVVRASAQDFGAVWSDYQENVSRSSAPTPARALESSLRKARKAERSDKDKNAHSTREDSEAPEADCSLFWTLKVDIAAAKGNPHRAILADLLAYANKFHQSKWRFFRQKINNVDFIRMAAVHIVSLEGRAKIAEHEANQQLEEIAKYEEEVEALRAELATARAAEAPEDDIKERFDRAANGKIQCRARERVVAPRGPKCRASAQFLIDRYSTILPTEALDELRARHHAIVTSSEKWQLSIPFAIAELRELHPGITEGGVRAEPENPAGAQPSAGKSSTDRLLELKSLLNDGLITQEEYDDRRRAILGSI